MRDPVAEAAPKSRPFPERVGPYELLLPIGTGGMATVYLARVSRPGGFVREVALKLMHAHVQEKPETNPLVEAKLASRIRHPNVVPVLDVGEDVFGMYLIMDYVEGDSLAGLVASIAGQRKLMPLPIALRILCDALAGLQAAHDLRDDAGELLHIVHRDFSPHNILVGIDGAARLSDFGIAKTTDRITVTEPGLIKGKIRYMSPEQARGARVDRRSDVWAAGVIAWELLTGKRLYSASEDVENLLRIVTEDAPRLREVRADLPRELDEIVASALTREADKRCASADAMRKRLLEACRGDIADPSEVAVFVTSIAQEKLQARRDKIVQVLRLRSEMGALIEIAPDRTPDGSSSSSAADHRAPRHVDEIDALAREETVSTAVVPRASRPRALNRKLAAMALGLAVSLGIAAFVTLRWNESSPSAALTDDRSPSGPGPIVTATPAPSVSGMALPDGSSAVASPAEAASAVVVSTPSSAAPVPFKRGGSLPASPSAKPHTTQPPAPLASSPYSVKR